MKSNTGLYKTLLEELGGGRRAVVLTELKDGSDNPEAPAKTMFTEAEIEAPEAGIDARAGLTRAALESGLLQVGIEDGRMFIAEPYFPESRLIVLGGGHIALPLVEFASKCGFSVSVADDRPTFANEQRFPWAKKVVCESFSRCIPLLNINASAFVVIITRGHRHDIDCLKQVLGLETAYTGMIGSRRRVRAAMEQLLAEGYPKEKLDEVRAPIGLDIGAQTPEEIAISILSEVIKYKRQHTKSVWPELDCDVLCRLAQERDGPAALVTIIETKGSVPRDTGAKMIVWPDGRTEGSVGGGCSESSIMRTAYDIIKRGGCKIEMIDMTGDVAEDEGMVCGGTMKVLIEQYIP